MDFEICDLAFTFFLRRPRSHLCLAQAPSFVLDLSRRDPREMANKFEAPTIKAGTSDPGKALKLAERVENTLTNFATLPESKNLVPHSVLVSPLNREGAPPNVPHVHKILKGMLNNGFDRQRPPVGICVEYKSAEGKAKLLSHNKRFSDGCLLLPPIVEEGPLYGSLACSHLNISLRCIASGIQSPAGNLSTLMGEKNLKEVVTNGHKWWILPETVPDQDLVDISLWRNQDQNENQATHEIEILQSILETASQMPDIRVSLGDVVAKVMKKNPAKIPVSLVQVLTKYWSQFLGGNKLFLVHELVDYHSNTVDPNELIVNAAFFTALTSEKALSSLHFLRHYLLLTHYTEEVTKCQSSGASVAAFIEVNTLTALCKKADVCLAAETKIVNLRDKYLPLLEAHLGTKQALLELQVLVDWFLRLTIGKALPEPVKTVRSLVGKYTEEKDKALGYHWAALVDRKYPQMDFLSTSGLKVEVPDAQSGTEVDLRMLKREGSQEVDPVAKEPQFNTGDLVTVVRRMTWTVPLKKDPQYRKNLVLGQEGVIVGFADEKQREALLKATLNVPSGKMEVTDKASCRNLMLTSTFILQKGSSEAASASGGTSADPEHPNKKDKKATEKNLWFLDGRLPEKVKLEVGWHKLLADTDGPNREFWHKSKIGVALESIAETFPKYTDKDLAVVLCANDKGVWQGEIWTQRAFEKDELLLAPLASQIKSTHLTGASNSPVGCPRTGRGAHPQGLGMAIDGRSRGLIAATGSIDGSAHHGNLFWMVGGTSKASDANMAKEHAAFKISVALKLSGKKRKLSTEWGTSEAPTIEYLVNKKALAMHTKLLVFHAEAKKKC